MVLIKIECGDDVFYLPGSIDPYLDRDLVEAYIEVIQDILRRDEVDYELVGRFLVRIIDLVSVSDDFTGAIEALATIIRCKGKDWKVEVV